MFDQLDKNKTGELDAAFVADTMLASTQMLERKKTAHDVFEDFLHTSTFREVEGKVTRNEFENYYRILSSIFAMTTPLSRCW